MVHEAPLPGVKSSIKFDLTPFQKKEVEVKQLIEGAVKPLTETEKQREALMLSFREAIASVRKRAAVEAVRPPGLITNSAGFTIYTKTLNTLVSREGCFKSTVLNVIAAAMIRRSEEVNYHYLGFGRDTSVEKVKLLIIDTEQDESYSVVKRLQSISLMAGYQLNEIPDNIEVLPLVRYTLSEKLEALKSLVPEARKKDPESHLIVILDIITDFLRDINDSKDSPEITATLNKLANDLDCTFLLAIHEAKTSNGARGHIGSELIIKSRCVMKITEMRLKPPDEGVVNPVYRLTVVKNSFGRKGSHFQFSFENENGLLRYATVVEKENVIEPRTHRDSMELLIEKFGMYTPFTVKSPGDSRVRKELVDIFGKDKDNTIRLYLLDLNRKSPVLLETGSRRVSLIIRKGKPQQYIIVESSNDTIEGLAWQL